MSVVTEQALLLKLSPDGLQYPSELTTTVSSMLTERGLKLIEGWVGGGRVEVKGVTLKPYV